nr:pentatricopeptide repeat-containing protein [Tanacetum cinerariifolium]
MPRKTIDDYQNTRSYILIISTKYNAPLKHTVELFENRCIHEGWVIYQDFNDLVYVKSMIKHIGFECLLTISEQILPRFILEFYSQYRVKYYLEGQMFVKFVFQNQLFSFTLEEFDQILCISYKGDCSFSDKGSLNHLESSVPTGDPYQTNPPSPDEIKLYIQVEREDVVTRIRHDHIINFEENQILTREITPIMKTWVDIIRENNLAFFVAKRMEFVTKQARLILPYRMLLTRLFNYVMFENPKLSNDCYVLYDLVMLPLTAQQEQKTRKDYGTKRRRPSTSASSLSAFGQPSSFHYIDDDNDGNDKGTSRASTLSPTRFVNSLSNDIPQVFSNPPNIDPNMEVFYTRQTEMFNRQV